MGPWKENPHQLLQIDISWNTGDGRSQILLERWRVHYEYNNNTGMVDDIKQQLKQVYRRVGVMLRVLYSYVRMLPANRVSSSLFHASSVHSDPFLCRLQLYNSTQRSGNSLPSMEYTLYSPDKDDFGTASSRLRFSQDGSCGNYSPPSIDTPYGMLGLSVVYRRDLSAQVCCVPFSVTVVAVVVLTFLIPGFRS
jgi:hypothetical protein